jgi:hypothetical protein
MLSLHELQKQFAYKLLNDTGNIAKWVKKSNSMSAQEHVTIYQSSSIGALQKVLQEIYPVCLKLVGEDFFIAMINEYILITPSTSFDLGHYGETLPNFISSFPPAQHLVYLSEVARLEWAWHHLFSATKNTTLDFDKLSLCYESDGENILFLLPENSTLLTSHFPIHDIWAANQEESDTIITLKDDENYFYLVWCNQLEMRIDLLSHTEWKILTWIQQEYNLGKITQLIQENFAEINFTSVLLKLIKERWLCDFIIQP